MLTAAATAILAFGFSLGVTPLVRRLAFRVGATDMPDARRIHTRPTARAGGFAVLASAVLALAIAGALPPALGPLVLAGAALLLFVGVIDDIASLSAKTKLLVQLVAAGLAVGGGLRFHFFGADAGSVLLVLDAGLTVAWIVLITNAFNLSDGVDGLASGIGIFACLSLAAIGMRGGDMAAATTALALAAALLGFLPYNSNPASIFLGDCGSLVIGYALAVLPLVGTGGTPLPLLGALLLVALPATDTSIAIARRFLSHCLRTWGAGSFARGLVEGLRNTMSPDRRHIHHRLLDLGLSQRRAVGLLYVAAFVTSGLAYLVAGSPGWPIDLFALAVAVAVLALVRTLGFDELQPARSGLVLPVLRRIARHGWLVPTIDAGLVIAAAGSALVLTETPPAAPLAAAAALAFAASIQLVAFAAIGVYRNAWWVNEVSGFGLVLRACAAGSVAGYMALRLLGLPTSGPAALVQFALFVPAVTLMRFSPVLLRNAARAAGSAERALIYGTAREARQALRRLRRKGVQSIEPVGFVEFRARLQGRDLARLPVVGTLEGLPALVRRHRVRHLVIADPGLRGDALDWVRAVCRQLDVHVHRYVERLVPYDGRTPMPAEMARFRPASRLWEGRTARLRAGATDAAARGNGHGYAANAHGPADVQPLSGPTPGQPLPHGADIPTD